MSEHQAHITVHAPLHQVYTFFSHFNDFPKFMSFVKEVTYYDEQRSHWVAQFAGTHEWDAVNEDWLPDQQIGWRSTSGLENHGRVKFMPLSPEYTQVNVYMTYTTPAGIIGTALAHLGLDEHFDTVLQQDLQHFATMVEEAPPGALDPMQSHYLFHSDSAVNKGTTTQRQQDAMSRDPMMLSPALQERSARVEHEAEAEQQKQQRQTVNQERQQAAQQQAAQEQTSILRQQAERDQTARREQERAQEASEAESSAPHPIYDTLGGRHAGMERTALGDQDARSERFPGYHQDEMMARSPEHISTPESTIAKSALESPWNTAIRGSSIQGRDEETADKQQQQQPPEGEQE